MIALNMNNIGKGICLMKIAVLLLSAGKKWDMASQNRCDLIVFFI